MKPEPDVSSSASRSLYTHHMYETRQLTQLYDVILKGILDDIPVCIIKFIFPVRCPTVTVTTVTTVTVAAALLQLGANKNAKISQIDTSRCAGLLFTADQTPYTLLSARNFPKG